MQSSGIDGITSNNKGRQGRILRQEFPHLREWCDDHIRALGCFHGSVGEGWEVVEKIKYTKYMG